MSYLATLSDYVGKTAERFKKNNEVTAEVRPNGSNTENERLAVSRGKVSMESLFTAARYRGLYNGRSRVERNKKMIRRNLRQPGKELEEEDIMTYPQNITWSQHVSVSKTDSIEDTGWDTDLEIEEVMVGFDHSGKTAYIDSCQKSNVVPVSYYLRHMHDSELKLRHHQLGGAAVKPIATSLVSNAKILSLDLTDNALGLEGAQVICDMLRENCFITHLNLSENHLGPESASILSDIMILTATLTHLTISANQFDDRAAEFFADALLSTTKIEYLDLSHNQFSEVGGMILGPAIGENSTVKELNLSWNSFRRRGAAAIAQGVKQNIMIKKLNLSWNGFGAEGARELGKALMENTTLQELDIANNRITTEGAVLFGKGVAVNESMKTLHIGKNPMQSAGCWAICSAVLKNPHMVIQELDFEDILVNQDFRDIMRDLKNLLPDIKVNHGGLEPPMRPKVKVHPLIRLQNFITRNDIKLIDFFQKFDKDGSMSVSYEEFREGLQELEVNLSADDVNQLIYELDKDGDGEINYSELVIGNKDFSENLEREKSRSVLSAFSGASSVLRS